MSNNVPIYSNSTNSKHRLISDAMALVHCQGHLVSCHLTATANDADTF